MTGIVSEKMLDRVLTFFCQFLTNDAAALECIEAGRGKVFIATETDSLVFALNDLHELLDDARELEYPAFRKLLYQSSINQQLLKYQGRIELLQSSGKVDSNVYHLCRIESHHVQASGNESS